MAVANQKVLVFASQNPHSVDLRFRGVLGEDFLGKFDMLIDNAHGLLCLDDSGAMCANVKGPHIALQTPAQTPSDGLVAGARSQERTIHGRRQPAQQGRP
jgi:hypothetical protein